MVHDWRERLSLGVVHFMLYPVLRDEGPIAESFEALALDEFLDVIEVRRSNQPGMHQRLRAIADTTGVSIGIGAQPPLLLGKLSLNNPDDAGRQAAIDEVKKSIDAAYDMGARICAALSGPVPSDPAQIEPQIDLLVDSCIQLCRYAESRADDAGYLAWLTLEQFDDAIDKCSLIGPSDRTADFAARVSEEVANFGLTIDLSHIPLLGEDITDLVTTLKPWTVHVHVGNALMSDKADKAYGDKHPRFGYPGSENDWHDLKSFLEVLTYAGYFETDVPTGKPVVTFEVQPMGDETPEQVWAQTKRQWLKAWAMLGSEE
jgi:sugar phosphate isomerase/epimerase